ncbi:MAG TPA: UvrD-helicase domain-containing protein [Bryobacteraceae bacterium]|nr:UvrD-helicase domain-containing protein [Bryobacteraceae bacterium]
MNPTPQTHIVSDEDARERIRYALDESFLVEAAAGTGKTRELVQRIVHCLGAGGAVERLVAVTFTYAAAGELKIRLRQELDAASQSATDAAIRQNLQRSMEQLERAWIGTIHSFCAQLLRERPVEAGVDPGFEEMSGQEAQRLFGTAFGSWLSSRLNDFSPALRRCFTRLSWRDAWESGSPLDQLRRAAWTLIEWRDFNAPWRSEAFDRASAIDVLLAQVRELAGLRDRCPRPYDPLFQALRPARELVDRCDRAETRDYDSLEALLIKFRRDLNRNFQPGSGPYAEGISRATVIEKTDQLKAAIEQFRRQAEADLAVSLRAELQGMVLAYDELKRRSGKLDFTDLLLFARNLLRDNAEIRSYFQQRFDHIFVDEFQDTDQIQIELLLLLSAAGAEESSWKAAPPKPGKLFLVGDPNQSIYKFRGADANLYETVRHALREHAVGYLKLPSSRRSLQNIQEFVNAAFENELTNYVPLLGGREAIPGQPSVTVLPAPTPYGVRQVTKGAVNACLPDAVAGYVEWLWKHSHWKVSDPSNAGRALPIEPRHICILFRRFVNNGRDLTRDYVRSLDARGVPHILVGSRFFHDREEIETLRTALSAIEWPEDELSVFATIRGSLFAVSDGTLLKFRDHHGRLHPFRDRPLDLDEEFAPIHEALSLLAELHRQRNHRPIAATLNELLEATRAHAGFAFRKGGDQVLANVYRLVDLARSFEASGGTSFRAFIEHLNEQLERAETAEAPIIEDTGDAVKLMTVHNAKGLEFPIVILADLTANLCHDPECFVDADRRLCATRLLRCAPWELLENEELEKQRENQEGVRVAYVAATRARDLLVVTAVGDQPWKDGWLSPLNKAIYPTKQNWRSPQPASGCPPFGDATVLRRPSDLDAAGEFSVRPGRHTASAGTHELVWWDPATLHSSETVEPGLVNQKVLVAMQPQLQEGLDLYAQWMRLRDAAVDGGSKPRFRVHKASEAPAASGRARGVELISISRAAGRPGGRRFGTLVHAVLTSVEWNAPEDHVRASAELHARVIGATTEEMAAATDAVLRTLLHPLIQEAWTSERCHREFPLMVRLKNGDLAEGIADLAWLKGGQWSVVDFKTDADLSIRRAKYERQLQIYSSGLAQAMSAPVRAYLVSL